MRTRREIKKEIRGMEKVVKAASIGDDGPDFANKRRVLERLRAELADIDAPPEPPALPPAGNGTFVMRHRETGETEAQRWGKVINMRRGNPAQRNIWDPEADAVRAARIEKGKEHIKGMIPRSAMRAGHPR